MREQTRKICIATPEFPPEQWGGLARTVSRVAGHATDVGLEVHVAHFTVDSNTPILLDENRKIRKTNGFTVHNITLGKEEPVATVPDLWDCPHNLTLQMMYQSLEILDRNERFDLFHSFFLYPVGYICGMLAHRLGIPSIVTLVGNDVKRYIFSPEKVSICRTGLENADRVVALSKDLGDMANALTPISEKTRIIYNSVKIPLENRKINTSHSSPFRIGCAGIFKYAKGLPYLFKAVADLAVHRDIKLELVGKLRDNEKKIYDYMLSKTGIGDILKLMDPIPHDLMHQWLRGLDVFVLPSLTEGCPNVLMEAMAVGVPVVATRTGAAEHLVEDRVSGLLVPWGDSGSLASALIQIIDDRNLGESLGAAGRTRMKSFSSVVERRAWENVYRELLNF
ncbi:MAG: glycosyltransferase [Desulfomonile sp.]